MAGAGARVYSKPLVLEKDLDFDRAKESLLYGSMEVLSLDSMQAEYTWSTCAPEEDDRRDYAQTRRESGDSQDSNRSCEYLI
jgi:hypothetical protein